MYINRAYFGLFGALGQVYAEWKSSCVAVHKISGRDIRISINAITRIQAPVPGGIEGNNPFPLTLNTPNPLIINYSHI